MSTTRRVVIFMLVFVVLSGISLVSGLLGWRANNDAEKIFYERNSLSFAAYEMRLSSSALSRLMRVVVVVDCEERQALYWQEIELDRQAQAYQVFAQFDLPPNEAELFEILRANGVRMKEIELEVLRLHEKGSEVEARAKAFDDEYMGLGSEFGQTGFQLVELINARTQSQIDNLNVRRIVFSHVSMLLAIVLILAGLFAWAKTRSDVFRYASAGFIVLACVNFFILFSANAASSRWLEAQSEKYLLIEAVYDTEISTEVLTRWVRRIAVMGDGHESHQAELELERFRNGLGVFINHKAPNEETNVMLDIVGRIMALRQMDEEIINIRDAGYIDNSIQMAFGDVFTNFGQPTNELSYTLRQTVAARTAAEIDYAYDNYRTWRTMQLASSSFTILAGLVALIMRMLCKTPPTKTTESYIVKRLKQATMTTRLVVSFGIIIAIFIICMGAISMYSTRTAERYSHNEEFMMARLELILEYNIEFNEMRRLIRQSFMNEQWNEDANIVTRQQFARQITNSYNRLMELSEQYINSIATDPYFEEQPNDIRIHAMNTVVNYTISIFETFQYYFDPPDGSVDYGNVERYAAAAETMLQMLRQVNAVNRAISTEQISEYQRFSRNVIILSLVLFVSIALYLAFLMIQSFMGQIKILESNAALVEQGNIETLLRKDTPDEISKIFRTVVMEQQGKLEAVQENNRAKTKFLASMSHEIRTPLTAVLGISEIQLQSTSLPIEAEEAFAKIYSSADTLLRIVDDILDLSKIDAGKLVFYNEEYETAVLMGDIVQLNLAYLGSKKLKFLVEIDPNLPKFMVGDALRIKQVLNNLLSNAFKYTERGTVTLRVKSETTDKKADVTMVVSDTGRGMTQEQLDALFDEYSRFHAQETRFEPGSGLGMPITNNLIKMMDGTIAVDSQLEKGTTVTVVIPQEVPTSETIGAETAENIKNFNTDTHAIVKRMSFRPEPMPYGRVLVVDDVEANLYVARGLMGLYELQLETCTNALDAIQRVQDGEVYDIIFMDQMMPEMNGTEAVAIIRDHGYTAPIVALTAFALVGEAEQFLKNGFDGFLSKP
ncbi:MAG: ATP-binding protein, partial [Defluviitaleaceae bacterium]|nr:ATP-binding protein [Defluviitaleaceae bacterium]